ncbi:hypothetical protein IIO_05839 [Bacillus cereus VD115]|nr:hypothetical protein IIO_05839 [Bacillus cereus VD115]
MWKNLILEIEKIEKSFNDKLNTPATDSEVKKLRERMKKSFNVDLPSEYEEFLKTVNGLDFNGLVLYGVDSYLLDTERDESICGLIETNEIWYENEFQKKYLFLGDSNAAHHLTPWNDKRAIEAQELLKEFGIHHDSAANGVFLPYKVNEYVTTEVLHIGNHSTDYMKEVTKVLKEVKEYGGTQADAVAALHDIRTRLLDGSLKLNSPK